MALAYGSYFIAPIVDMFAGLAVGAVSNYLAPVLRLRWPKLAH